MMVLVSVAVRLQWEVHTDHRHIATRHQMESTPLSCDHTTNKQLPTTNNASRYQTVLVQGRPTRQQQPILETSEDCSQVFSDPDGGRCMVTFIIASNAQLTPVWHQPHHGHLTYSPRRTNAWHPSESQGFPYRSMKGRSKWLAASNENNLHRKSKSELAATKEHK